MVSSGQGKAAAPKALSGHACTGNERRLVAGISSFAFQVGSSMLRAVLLPYTEQQQCGPHAGLCDRDLSLQGRNVPKNNGAKLSKHSHSLRRAQLR